MELQARTLRCPRRSTKRERPQKRRQETQALTVLEEPLLLPAAEAAAVPVVRPPRHPVEEVEKRQWLVVEEERLLWLEAKVEKQQWPVAREVRPQWLVAKKPQWLVVGRKRRWLEGKEEKKPQWLVVKVVKQPQWLEGKEEKKPQWLVAKEVKKPQWLEGKEEKKPQWLVAKEVKKPQWLVVKEVKKPQWLVMKEETVEIALVKRPRPQHPMMEVTIADRICILFSCGAALSTSTPSSDIFSLTQICLR